MGRTQISIYFVCLACSLILNVLLLRNNNVYWGGKWELSWSRRAAEEAEAVAEISCSGHGRTYLDGLVVDGSPVCECNSCFGGPDCSQFLPDCVANADRGDPLFLEPFWMQNAASSAMLVSYLTTPGRSHSKTTCYCWKCSHKRKVYQQQTDFFRSVDFQFQGEAALWKNKSDSSLNFIEFVNLWMV